MLPLLLDCDHNPDCLHNRYVGTARSAEGAAVALERAAASIERTAQASALTRCSTT